MTDGAVARVAQGWREKHRFFHTEEHLQFLTSQIEDWFREGNLTEKERSILLMAAFFHDVVYNPMAPDNEVQSVQLFDQLTQHPDKGVISDYSGHPAPRADRRTFGPVF